MEILGCGHAQTPAPIRLCVHLLGAKEVDYMRCLRGVELEFDAACKDCAARFEKGEAVEWITVCAPCYELWLEDVWDFKWSGNAPFLESPRPFNATLIEVQFSDILAAALAVAPFTDGRILALLDGELQIFEASGATVLMKIDLPVEKDGNWSGHHLAPRLLISPDARFAALVHDFGRFGVLIDIEKRRVSMNLDRGDYHPETTPFPVAFFECDEHILLVHGTDWNRLDISNPQTGELMTERGPTRYQNGEARPAHYLDYFHGQLHVSPDSQWIVNDGWVWHPMGIPAWWNLQSWARQNAWESEDGPSRCEPIYRAYHWNVGMCWIGETRLAISGIGDDDDAMIDGARIFGVDGKEIGAFAGPKGAFFSDGARLFSVDESGLQLWNIESCARTGRIDGFRPQFQIEGALIEIAGCEMRRWNYLS